ncbi:Short coiled-coil protein B family protein, partial [Paragonimus heterotremus]
ILELQHTLEDLSARVDVVKEENLKLHSENQILGQYIENMMANSSVFQSTSPHSLENRRHVTSGNTRVLRIPLMGLICGDHEDVLNDWLPKYSGSSNASSTPE